MRYLVDTSALVRIWRRQVDPGWQPDDIWDMVAAVRRELVPHSVHQGLSVADLVVAATARIGAGPPPQ